MEREWLQIHWLNLTGGKESHPSCAVWKIIVQSDSSGNRYGIAMLPPRWELRSESHVNSELTSELLLLSILAPASCDGCGSWDLGIAPRGQCAGVREFHSLGILFFFSFSFSFELTLLGYAIAHQSRELRACRHTSS